MVLCSVPSCRNRSDHRNWKTRINSGTKDFKITFHSFPKDSANRSLWFDILGINLPSIPSGARICSVHFDEKFLDRSSPSLVRLKPNALPRNKLVTETAKELNVSDSITKTQEKSSDADQNSGNKTLHEVCSSYTVNLRAVSPNTDVSILQLSTSKADKATMVSVDDFPEVSKDCKSSLKLSTSKADKSTMVSSELLYQSPEKCRLRRRLEFVKDESRKKIRNLQQNIRRQTGQIITLKYVLKTLQEKQLNEEQS